MAFSNEITGGQGALVRPAIKSPDYAPGATGWSINRDGSADFNNLVIHSGNHVIIEDGAVTITGDDGTKIVMSDNNGVAALTFYDTTGTEVGTLQYSTADGFAGVSLQTPDGETGRVEVIPSGDTPGVYIAGTNIVIGDTPVAAPASTTSFDGFLDFGSNLNVASPTISSSGSFTPTIIGGGSAAWNSTGKYIRVGQLLFLSILITVTTAGTGTAVVGIGGLPMIPDRSNTRMVGAISLESIIGTTGSTFSCSGTVHTNVGSSGAQFDRINCPRNSTGAYTTADLEGNQLASGAILSYTGFIIVEN